MITVSLSAQETNPIVVMKTNHGDIEIEMLKDEKGELLAEMTESNKLAEDDILNSLSSDELKQ